MVVSKEITKANVVEFSNYILKHYGPMSHLKLQKLLYYCEAYHLAYFEAPLINENFQAWVHGPVCREVYDILKDKSILYSDIAFDNLSNPDTEIERLSTTQLNLIEDVLKSLVKWTDLELEAATHKEQPWLTARKGYSPNQRCEIEIDKNEMRIFYQKESESWQ